MTETSSEQPAPPRANVKIYDRPSNLALALRRPQLWLALAMLGLGGGLTYYYVVMT